MDNELNSLALRISKFKNKSTSGKYKYPVSIKTDVVTYAHNNRHKKVPELSEELGVSTSCLFKWLKNVDFCKANKLNKNTKTKRSPTPKEKQSAQPQFIQVNNDEASPSQKAKNNSLIEVQLIKFIGNQSQVESILKNLFPSMSS